MEQFFNSLVNFPFFLVTWLTFSAAGTVSFLFVVFSKHERITIFSFLNHCFPFESWSKKSARVDVIIYVAGKLTDKVFLWLVPLSTVLVATVLSTIISSIYPDHAIIQPNYLIVFFCSLFLYLVFELSYYITHYMQHYVPVLWEIHKVHHSATFLSPLTARRAHPINLAFDGITGGLLGGIPAGFFAILFGFSLTDIFLLHACAAKLGNIITLDGLKHSHFPVSFGFFDRILMSPHMHQIHHSCKVEHWDKNFGGNLSIWDWIFDTAYKPIKDEEIVYGLGNREEQHYETLTGVYLDPLLKIWRLITGGLPQEVATLQPRSFAEGIFWRKSSYTPDADPNGKPLAIAEHYSPTEK